MAARLVLKSRHKYGAKATVVDGIRFPSKHEAKCWTELRLREQAGEIRNLKRQVQFELKVGEVSIGKYIADFTFEEPWGIPTSMWSFVVADAKGFKTPLYRWKKKHFEAQYRVTITEL